MTVSVVLLWGMRIPERVWLGLAVAIIAVFGIISTTRDRDTVPPVSAPAPSSTASGSRVITQNTWGCRERADFDRLTEYKAQGDNAATADLLGQFIDSGACTLLDTGDAVLLTDVGFGMSKVRRPGTTDEWWTYMEAVR